MIIHDVVQRSPEWVALRLGRVGSSQSDDMLATAKSGDYKASRKNLLAQLVLERLTGRPQERQFQSQAMRDGIEREGDALNLYEQISGRLVRSVGYVSHDELMAGCSPDGIVGDFVGLVEVKCPIEATHLDFVKPNGVIPSKYMKQIQHSLWLIPSLQWCDFVCYQPFFPQSLQLRVVRVTRKDVDVPSHDRAVRAFLAEVERELKVLLTMADLRGTLAASVAVA